MPSRVLLSHPGSLGASLSSASLSFLAIASALSLCSFSRARALVMTSAYAWLVLSSWVVASFSERSAACRRAVAASASC